MRLEAEQARERALEEERKKFSPEDDALYNKVNTQLQSILSEQRRAYLNSPAKRYKGYTIEEQIMAYGNNSVIPLSLRDEVYNLLTRQLKQRIINAPEILTAGNYIAAANDLVKWITDKIRTAGLDINTD